MKKYLLVIILALLSIALVDGQGLDDQGQVNDPATNERANTCYEENSSCETEWEWICGWHFIRWEANSDYVMPSSCAMLIPPLVSTVSGTRSSSGGGKPPCMITTPDYYDSIRHMSADTIPVVVIGVPSFINSCGDIMTPTVNLVANVYLGAPNWYYCDVAGIPYEIHVTWASVSGSYTEFITGDCLV